MKTWSDFGIDLNGQTGVEVQTTCPECSPTRKKPKVKCLSANTEKAVWVCHHCGFRGTLKSGVDSPGIKQRLIIRPTYTAPSSPDDRLIAWFADRGISQDTIQNERIALQNAYLPQVEAEVACIAFPYFLGQLCANVKYRGLEPKAFRQIAGAEKILYRQNSIKPEAVVITEGEMDALSVVEAGWSSVVSVPDGAPPANAKNYSSKFTFLDQEPNPFDGVKKIILAVDNDAPGKALEEELSRRLGRDRCWRVSWPMGCKDANDVLRYAGKEELLACLERAEPWPIQDAVSVIDLADAIATLYQRGLQRGLSTGWTNLDAHYTIEPGQLTVVTGIPSHGKSEWLDALMIQLATLHGWRFAICSPENIPAELHLSKLLEKHTGQPFRPGVTQRMSPAVLSLGLEWLHAHITFLIPSQAMTIPAILERATALVRRLGVRGLILDPFNEFDHTRPKGQTETEYIGDMLSALKHWARQWQCHVWLVAHPQKLYRREDGSYPVPTPYDINGSANFRNKADNCITVWRDVDQDGGPTDIHVQKVRFKHIGKPGMVSLQWNPINGRYHETEEVIDVREER